MFMPRRTKYLTQLPDLGGGVSCSKSLTGGFTDCKETIIIMQNTRLKKLGATDKLITTRWWGKPRIHVWCTGKLDVREGQRWGMTAWEKKKDRWYGGRGENRRRKAVIKSTGNIYVFTEWHLLNFEHTVNRSVGGAAPQSTDLFRNA